MNTLKNDMKKIKKIIGGIFNHPTTDALAMLGAFSFAIEHLATNPNLSKLLFCLCCVWIFTIIFNMQKDVKTVKCNLAIITRPAIMNTSAIIFYKQGDLTVESLRKITTNDKVKELCQNILDAKKQIKATTYTKDYSRPTDTLPYTLVITHQPQDEIDDAIKNYEECVNSLDNYLENKYGL